MTRKIDWNKKIITAARLERSVKEMCKKPVQYVYCLKENCSQAQECLHKVFFEKPKESHHVITVFNPYLQQHEDGKCPDFKVMGETKKIAVGFTAQVARMDDETLKRFQAECMKTLCKSVYYDMRAGKRLLLPEDQLFFRNCAARVGWNFPADGFDKMHTVPSW